MESIKQIGVCVYVKIFLMKQEGNGRVPQQSNHIDKGQFPWA